MKSSRIKKMFTIYREQQVISGTHYQLGIVVEDLATDEDQDINQTQVSIIRLNF